MATLSTTWVKRLINGVLTKTFAFAHVKSTYYNYTDNVTLQDKLDKMDASLVPVTTAGDGSAYTATVPGITELFVGLKIIIIPHVVSASTTPTLNLNGLGAKRISMLTTVNYAATVQPTLATWLSAGKPIELTYNGTYWITDLRRTSASALYGHVPVTGGGTGAADAEGARTNLEISAENTPYSNTDSGLAAANAQDALDIIANGLKELFRIVNITSENTTLDGGKSGTVTYDIPEVEGYTPWFAIYGTNSIGYNIVCSRPSWKVDPGETQIRLAVKNTADVSVTFISTGYMIFIKDGLNII